MADLMTKEESALEWLAYAEDDMNIAEFLQGSTDCR